MVVPSENLCALPPLPTLPNTRLWSLEPLREGRRGEGEGRVGAFDKRAILRDKKGARERAIDPAGPDVKHELGPVVSKKGKRRE